MEAQMRFTINLIELALNDVKARIEALQMNTPERRDMCPSEWAMTLEYYDDLVKDYTAALDLIQNNRRPNDASSR
jgi:hypothetical protein